MEKKPIPFDILRERVFDAFKEQHANSRPVQRLKRDRIWQEKIEGTLSQGLGAWIAEYSFKEQRWTALINRPITGSVKVLPRIDLTFRDDRYGIEPYFHPAR